MKQFLYIPIALLGLGLASFSVQADPVRNLNDLRAQMTQQGKPALVIVGAEWCVYCRELAQEMATVPELQPLQRQFAILKIDVDSPVWELAKKELDFGITGVPALYVFRADGKNLYANGGKPADMQAFLKNQLDKAGTILTTEQARDLSRDLSKIQGLLRKNDLMGALAIAQAHKIEKSYAQPALAMQEVQTQLNELAVTRVTELGTKLQENPTDPALVIELIQFRDASTESRDLLAKINPVIETYVALEPQQVLFSQAEQLLKADQLRVERKRSEAMDIYKELIERHPDSAIAALAKERMGIRESASATEPIPAKVSKGDEKKAAAYLRLAQQLLELQSPKASEYLQKTIDAAPESEAADEARKLLK
ncbi:MAG: thioredoxin family protein [Planctomycetaceae bacterium]|nr:thioredoxin family protein [Planctomycetaceae bacterium]